MKKTYVFYHVYKDVGGSRYNRRFSDEGLLKVEAGMCDACHPSLGILSAFAKISESTARHSVNEKRPIREGHYFSRIECEYEESELLDYIYSQWRKTREEDLCEYWSTMFHIIAVIEMARAKSNKEEKEDGTLEEK